MEPFEEEYRAYVARQKPLWDRYAIEETARKIAYGEIKTKEWEEGYAKGKAEAKLKKWEENFAEGKEEKGLAVARAMKEDGHPVAMIAKYTGLTEEEINAL